MSNMSRLGDDLQYLYDDEDEDEEYPPTDPLVSSDSEDIEWDELVDIEREVAEPSMIPSPPAADPDDPCSICLEQKVYGLTLTCRHQFCMFCVLPWLFEKGTCPLCRQVLSTPNGRPWPRTEGPRRHDAMTVNVRQPAHERAPQQNGRAAMAEQGSLIELRQWRGLREDARAAQRRARREERERRQEEEERNSPERQRAQVVTENVWNLAGRFNDSGSEPVAWVEDSAGHTDYLTSGEVEVMRNIQRQVRVQRLLDESRRVLSAVEHEQESTRDSTVQGGEHALPEASTPT